MPPFRVRHMTLSPPAPVRSMFRPRTRKPPMVTPLVFIPPRPIARRRWPGGDGPGSRAKSKGFARHYRMRAADRCALNVRPPHLPAHRAPRDGRVVGQARARFRGRPRQRPTLNARFGPDPTVWLGGAFQCGGNTRSERSREPSLRRPRRRSRFAAETRDALATGRAQARMGPTGRPLCRTENTRQPPSPDRPPPKRRPAEKQDSRATRPCRRGG